MRGFKSGWRQNCRLECRRAWRVEFWHIGTGGQVNAKFAFVAVFHIVLSQPFAKLTSSNPDDRIYRRIVLRRPVKNFYADEPFLKQISAAKQSLFDDVFEKARISFAVAKGWTLDDPIQLSHDRLMPIEERRN